MTRKENIKKNLIFSLLKFVIQLILQFVLRTILIHSMGAEYLGINGLFTNIFSFLNLAELGIGSAIVFSMYKPIAENDIEKIKSLQLLYKKFYLYIALIVLLVGGVITPFVRIFLHDELTIEINIYLLYSMYLFDALIGYFSAHKRSLLFAYQRKDLENKIKMFCTILMTVFQAIVIIVFKNYYLFFSIQILFTLIDCFLIHFIANKYFPKIRGKAQPIDAKTKKEISKNIAALSLHKIGWTVVCSTDNILISTFCGVIILGAYSNYSLIVSSIISFFALFVNSISASVGDLIASADKEKAYLKFKQINFIFSYLSSFTTICMVVLFQSFITLWTGGEEFLLSNISVLLICSSFYLGRMRQSVLIFRDGAGLYWQDRWKPIVEAFVNLIVSIIFARLIGLNGIFIGTIISTIVAPLWVEPCVLYKYYFKKNVKNYFCRYFLDFLVMISSCIICYFVCSFIPDYNLWWVVLKFIVCISLSNLLLIICYFKSDEFQETFKVLKSFLKKTKK